jgi:hypothetical protein
VGDTKLRGTRPGHAHLTEQDDVVLVTDAARSRVEERDERVRRYLWSMAVRTLAFILAVWLLRGWEQWVAIAISLVLPWIAVTVANAGPKRQEQDPAFFVPPPNRGLGSAGEQPADDRRGR